MKYTQTDSDSTYSQEDKLKSSIVDNEMNFYLLFKRFCDVTVSLVFIVVLIPVYIIISLLVKFDSPGSILYRGIRTGLRGEEFKILKFRTMIPDAEQRGGLSTSQNDPRITSMGHFLRKYKLDELPQLLNVFLGQMSIVGPRPEMPKYTQEYSSDESIILTVRPGITDFASIEFSQLGDILGVSNADEVYENQVKPVKNKLRVSYVNEMSLSTDLSIIFRTFFKILSH